MHVINQKMLFENFQARANFMTYLQGVKMMLTKATVLEFFQKYSAISNKRSIGTIIRAQQPFTFEKILTMYQHQEAVDNLLVLKNVSRGQLRRPFTIFSLTKQHLQKGALRHRTTTTKVVKREEMPIPYQKSGNFLNKVLCLLISTKIKISSPKPCNVTQCTYFQKTTNVFKLLCNLVHYYVALEKRGNK